MAGSLPKPKPTSEQRSEADGIVDGAGLAAAVKDVVPAPSNPVGVAEELLKQRTQDGLLTLRHWRGEWRQWSGTHWPEVEQAEVAQWLYGRLHKAEYVHVDPKTLVQENRPWRPNRARVGDVLDAMAKTVLVPASTEAPSWLDDTAPGRPAADQVIAVANGLLEVGHRKRHEHTPAYFNQHAVPFDYDPGAPEPAEWLGFLGQLWPSDPEAVETLQEWFGLVLTGNTSHQKILLITGPPRSGKGTIARVLAALVGKGNHASPTLASLGSNFGLAPLIGKPLAIVSDARLTAKADVGSITERLLSVSGEDAQTVDRKYRDAWTGQLSVRFMILSNELPRLGDASGAIASRFVILTLGQSFLGKEDPTLTSRLLKELPSILSWSLDGLDRLTGRGAFREPESSADAVKALAELVSPMRAFLDERCALGAGETSTEQLYAAWRLWAGIHGHTVTSSATFGRDLRAAEPSVKRQQRGGGTSKRWVYVGLSLLDQAPPQPQAPATTAQAPPPSGHLPRNFTPQQFMTGTAPTSANGYANTVVPFPDRRGG